MKITPITDKNSFSVPREKVTECLSSCDGVKLKVLLYVLASPEFDEEALCDELDITKKSLIASLDFWAEKEVIALKKVAARSTKEKKKEIAPRHSALVRSAELPRYTSDEIADYIEKNNSRFTPLLSACQQYIGKVFNMAEIEVVVGLADYLKLDDDYILLLFSHCANMEKKSLRYIEKLAVGLFDEGILGYDELDAHLTSIEETHKMESSLRKLFGIGRRALTKKEKEAFELWVGKFKMPFAMIERAFEVTVENTGGASVPYCSAVLESWYTMGYTTVSEVDAAIEEYRHDKENLKDKKGSFDTNDFFEAALKRSYSKE